MVSRSRLGTLSTALHPAAAEEGPSSQSTPLHLHQPARPLVACGVATLCCSPPSAGDRWDALPEERTASAPPPGGGSISAGVC